jgi:hypothetical protein
MENYLLDDLILFLVLAFSVIVIFLIFYAIDVYTTNRITKKNKLDNHIYYLVELNKSKHNKQD